MKKSKKKILRGKNKFIRLEDANLKFVVKEAEEKQRSQNFIINECVSLVREEKKRGRIAG